MVPNAFIRTATGFKLSIMNIFRTWNKTAAMINTFYSKENLKCWWDCCELPQVDQRRKKNHSKHDICIRDPKKRREMQIQTKDVQK